jgi:hypothetical protein
MKRRKNRFIDSSWECILLWVECKIRTGRVYHADFVKAIQFVNGRIANCLFQEKRLWVRPCKAGTNPEEKIGLFQSAIETAEVINGKRVKEKSAN